MGQPGRVTKSVVLVTFSAAVRRRRKCLSSMVLVARKRRETPLAGGKEAETKPVSFFGRQQRPAGIAFGWF